MNRVFCSHGESARELQQGYLLAEQTAFYHTVQSHLSTAEAEYAPLFLTAVRGRFFRTVFQTSISPKWWDAWVRPRGWWLGTPSWKRDPVTHSAHSRWKFTVFHSGLRLNPTLILSTQEGNVVSGNQCVTSCNKCVITCFVIAIITMTFNYCLLGQKRITFYIHRQDHYLTLISEV